MTRLSPASRTMLIARAEKHGGDLALDHRDLLAIDETRARFARHAATSPYCICSFGIVSGELSPDPTCSDGCAIAAGGAA